MSTPSSSADRNLLFGILALQMDFINRDALIAAMHAWVLDKAKPLGQILLDQRTLRADAHALLEALVDKHLELHGNDAEKSLASVSSIGSVRQQLQGIADPDVQASLGHVSKARSADEDSYATRCGTVGTPTSSGLRFRVLRPHAQGGLGQVSVALDEELHREVALKEIHDRHADDPASRARFLLEAEITGRLEHPGVVPVYGLGQYADGRPFYAMRFIKGTSLQDAIQRFHRADGPRRDAGERARALRQLLGRFVDVCNAVAYAHSRGVLHRDLKPGNVMLGRYGETLVVDWGLAKPLGRAEGDGGLEEGALQPTSASGSAPTQLGCAIGTPPYMSPEQAAGRLDLLGPASDVYGLGATLYSLLTGKPPFEGKDVGLLLQNVQQGEFPKPRQAKPSVPAALEAVCLKAMALHPEARYRTALHLATDVERWLADEPVAAYREPWAGRLRRWVQRHRGLTAGLAGLSVAAVAALAVGLVAVDDQKQRAERALVAKAHAEQRTREAWDVSSKVFENWLSRQTGKTDPAQEAFLKMALACYRGFTEYLGETEEVHSGVARAHRRVGDISSSLGQHEDAEKAYLHAIAYCGKLADDFPGIIYYRQELATSHNNLGLLLARTGRPKDAERAYRDALVLQKQLAADFPAVPDYRQEQARTQNNLGNLLRSQVQPKDAELADRAALDLNRQLVAEFPAMPEYRQELAASYNNLATLLKETRRVQEASGAYREALGHLKRLAAELPAVPGYRQELARTHYNLGILLETGRPKDAERAYREALVLQKRLAADFPAVPGHRQELARTNNNLGILLANLGPLKEAEGAYREALAFYKQLAAEFPAVPDYRQELALSHNNLGNLLWSSGRWEQAESAYRAALTLYQQLAATFPDMPDDRLQLARSHNNLANLVWSTGRSEEAERAYRDALSVCKQLTAEFPNGPDYRHELAVTMDNLARLLRDRKDFSQARDLLEGAVSHHQAALKANPDNPAYRQYFQANHAALALTLAGLGDHFGADQTAHKLAALGWDPPSDGYYAACTLAQCVLIVEKDAKLPDAKRQELVRSDADRALALLRQAISKGFKDAAAMKKDTDLDPLRSHPEFKKLLKELEAKSKTEEK